MNGEISKDLVSEVFIKLWTKHADFDSFPQIQSFLYTSIRNACFNHLKGQKVVNEYQGHLIREAGREEMEDFVMKGILEAELARHLNEAIESLPRQCKRVMLASFNGLKTAEIAEKFGLSPQTVRNTRNRAVQILKERLPPAILAIALAMLN